MTDRAPNRFADFIRDATPEEKEAVYMEVMKNATDRQNAMTAPDERTDRAPTPLTSKCEICGEPMPPGEEMFKFHGYSGDCPKPPLEKDVSVEYRSLATENMELKAANAELRGSVTFWKKQAEENREQMVEIQRLKQAASEEIQAANQRAAQSAAELERVRKDAERYRWVRQQKHIDIAACWLVDAKVPAPSNGDELDAAIDGFIQALASREGKS